MYRNTWRIGYQNTQKHNNNNMIHYINNKPHKNIKLNKAKRHAVAHYRHKQAVQKIKSFVGILALMTLFATLLTATVYLLVGIN